MKTTIKIQVIEHAAKGKDLLIVRRSNSNIIELQWRDHAPFEVVEG